MTSNKLELEIENASPEAKKLLLDGNLLETTEAIALKLSNNFEFAQRIVKEYSLIFAGQTTKYLDIGLMDRAFSHCAIYATHGFGKGYSLKLIKNSGLFPVDLVKTSSLDNITEAALIGTVSDGHLVPPPVITEDVLIAPEFATLKGGTKADNLSALIRALQEDCELTRRVAMVGGLKEIINCGGSKGRLLQKELNEYEKMGMKVDLDKSQIHIKTSTSWIIASAKFGSESFRGRALLSFGDIDRYRWLSFLPSKDERLKIVSEVGSLPPISVNRTKISHCREAWTLLHTILRNAIAVNSITVTRDDSSYYSRKKVWDETQKVIMDIFDEQMNETIEDQIFNLRSRAEFNRLMYQHAVLKQFERDQGVDFSEPSKFIINYKEDGDFAKSLWINDYVPSIMDVIQDILAPTKHKNSVKRITKTKKGKDIVVSLLEKTGKCTRTEILIETRKAGISDPLVDNHVLPQLHDEGRIVRDKFGSYSLAKELRVQDEEVNELDFED